MAILGGSYIQSLARIPPGLGHWIEGPWRKSLQRGNVTNIVATWLRNCSSMTTKLYQHGFQMEPGGLLEVSWRSLGALKKAWLAKGGLPDAYETLLEASWGALGAKKVVLNGSWPLQEKFQDRFQPSWGPKGSQKGAQMGSKTESRNDSC